MLAGHPKAALAQGQVADIPEVGYRPSGEAPKPPLRRTADLLEILWAGQGTLSLGSQPALRPQASVSLHPLPWRSADAAGITTRSLNGLGEESTLALQLPSEARWCTPQLAFVAGSRLRLEAVDVEAGGAARLLVEWQPTAGAVWSQTEMAGAAGEALDLDLALPPGTGRLCLQARGGAVSVGEPRVVAPEPPGSDRRPRWIVLAVCDSLRGDILAQPDARRIAPTLVALSQQGLRYDQAVSSGAHTQAALLPLLTGRDLARVDPARAHRFTPSGTSLRLVYSRGNLAVSQLAQAGGYHSVFLGNNSFLVGAPLFARFSNRGKPDTGTVDTIAALPALFRRYADERVLLVYYVSTPHGFSSTPRRLFERFGCGSLGGVAAQRCAYDARVAHADEAIDALERGLADHGLDGRTLQILTADHGEVFGDGRKLETELYGKWWSLDEGHGGATHWNEVHVPLVVKGLGSGVWPGRVSTLDVVPTILAQAGLGTPQRLDGRPLPMPGDREPPERSLVSQGYCSQSVLEGPYQLVWWEAECAKRRDLGSERPLADQAELWRRGSLLATDRTDPKRLAPLVRRHREWLAERLPGEAWLLDLSGLGPARIRIETPHGRIADWGPSDGPPSPGSLAAAIDTDERVLRLDVRGDRGHFFVSTWPKATPVRFEVDAHGGAAPTTFVGRLQLPLPLLGRIVDPAIRSDLWLAAFEPPRPKAPGPALRVWRQAYHPLAQHASDTRSLTELDRVLREWGYIR